MSSNASFQAETDRRSGPGDGHGLADFLAQRIDRLQRALVLEMPERPAVAGVETLHLGAHAVDRGLLAIQRRLVSVSTAPGFNSPLSSSVTKATRGSARLEATIFRVERSAGSTASMRAIAASI